MFNKFFTGKKEDSKEEHPEIKNYSKPIEKKAKVEEKIKTGEKVVSVEKEVIVDSNTQQATIIGQDMKEDVKRFSRAFFNNKNEKRANAYKKFEYYLQTLDNNEKNRIKRLTFLEFKEKEDQIQLVLKNGFAQSLTKGSHINEDAKEIIEIIFNDIKKLASKGHKYWYYTTYIWQKREE
jgi:hypothetical protein